MSWVSDLKKSVKDYFANKKKIKQNEQRIASTRKKLSADAGKAMARANSMGMTRVNARQYSTLKPEDQAAIDRMLGKKKKPNGGK